MSQSLRCAVGLMMALAGLEADQWAFFGAGGRERQEGKKVEQKQAPDFTFSILTRLCLSLSLEP